MKTTRREFVVELSFAIAATAFASDAASSSRLPIAFSTLGCPDWDLARILAFAQKYGFSAIELRGLQGNMDLPSHALFAKDQVEATKRQFAASGIKIACVSSSARMGEGDASKRVKEIADAKRFVDLAVTLSAPYVRVFGDGVTLPNHTAPSQELKSTVAMGLKELGDYAGPKGVTVILESHDNFTSSATLSEVFAQADSPHVGLLWDAHHTFVTGGEDPAFTVEHLAKWIRHTHLKDSVQNGEDRKYVLTGRGTVPVKKQIEALTTTGYDGYLCFEWEKVWHPDLEDPEIAIADYAQVVSGYLAAPKNK
jgi:sugar phosphate isomerase/epimerase